MAQVLAGTSRNHATKRGTPMSKRGKGIHKGTPAKTSATASAKAPLKPLDPKEIFQYAIYFECATRLLSRTTLLQRSEQKQDLTKLSGKDHTILGMRSTSPTIPLFPTFPGFIPMIVNSALAIELFFKTIIVIDNPASRPMGHSLVTLLELLTRSRQDRLAWLYDDEFEKETEWIKIRRHFHDRDFTMRGMLKLADKSFEKWRYAYEGYVGDFLLQPVRRAILRMIIEMKPDWKPLEDTLDTLPIMQIR
jgi:hypothetical protein